MSMSGTNTTSTNPILRMTPPTIENVDDTDGSENEDEEKVSISLNSNDSNKMLLALLSESKEVHEADHLFQEPSSWLHSSPTIEERKEEGGCRTRGASLSNELSEHIDSDFECRACMELLFEPVTFPCGHSACRHCFLRATRTGNLRRRCIAGCQTVLPNGVEPQINLLLRRCIKDLYPVTYERRREMVVVENVARDAAERERTITTSSRDMPDVVPDIGTAAWVHQFNINLTPALEHLAGLHFGGILPRAGDALPSAVPQQSFSIPSSVLSSHSSSPPPQQQRQQHAADDPIVIDAAGVDTWWQAFLAPIMVFWQALSNGTPLNHAMRMSFATVAPQHLVEPMILAWTCLLQHDWMEFCGRWREWLQPMWRAQVRMQPDLMQSMDGAGELFDGILASPRMTMSQHSKFYAQRIRMLLFQYLIPFIIAILTYHIASYAYEASNWRLQAVTADCSWNTLLTNVTDNSHGFPILKCVAFNLHKWSQYANHTLINVGFIQWITPATFGPLLVAWLYEPALTYALVVLLNPSISLSNIPLSMALPLMALCKPLELGLFILAVFVMPLFPVWAVMLACPILVALETSSHLLCIRNPIHEVQRIWSQTSARKLIMIAILLYCPMETITLAIILIFGLLCWMVHRIEKEPFGPARFFHNILSLWFVMPTWCAPIRRIQVQPGINRVISFDQM